jgi:hypothetical protein
MRYQMEGSVLDVLMTGEAARICGVDRRTFLAKAAKYGVLPIAAPNGRALYERKDVDKVSKRIKAEKDSKKDL